MGNWKHNPDIKRIRGRKLQQLRQQLFAEQPLCQECQKHGIIKPATQRDHIVALFKHGSDTEDNVQALCDDCHRAKSLKEKGYKVTGCDNSGLPTDMSHHWR